jgi:hypothetical protein
VHLCPRLMSARLTLAAQGHDTGSGQDRGAPIREMVGLVQSRDDAQSPRGRNSPAEDTAKRATLARR